MIVVKRNYNLKLNPETIKNIVITALLSCMVFLSPYILPDKFSLLANFAATIIAALFSIKTLYKIIGPQVISELLSKIKLRLSTR